MKLSNRKRVVTRMVRVLAMLIFVGSVSATGDAQSSLQTKAQYVVGNGRCGPVYILENPPAYFSNPKTASQISDVIRILRAAPAQSDVECHDFTDAWAPYLYTDRKVQIAGLLIKLKRFDEAREELWSLYLRDGVLYRGRKLYYSMGRDKAISLLMSHKLWNVADIKRRLKESRYLYTEDIQAAYERRKRLASPRR